MATLFRIKGLVLLLLVVLMLVCSGIDFCEGRRGRHWRQRRLPTSSALAKRKGKGKSTGGGHGGRKGGGSSKGSIPSPNPSSSPSSNHSSAYNVLDFGAKGDGVTDDTKAFEAAWAAACKEEASTLKVPSTYTFLVGPISFSGPYCQPNIIFQLDGSIVAPTNPKVWSPGPLWWMEFTKLKGITIQGRGSVDGRGSIWWTQSEIDVDPACSTCLQISVVLGTKLPSIKPTAVRFYGSYNVTVTGIMIQNSPQCHLKFDNCEAVHVFNMSVSSPGSSLNTDGIHLQNSKDVSIHHCNLSCGHFFLLSYEYEYNTSTLEFTWLFHCSSPRFSIGGLGRDRTRACVSNVTVQNVNMYGTMTGVRIKTWQGGSGSVENIRFSNIRVSEVQTPIVIDQFYCDRIACKNQTSAVELSGIAYESIKGTFTVKPMHFACSDGAPCSGISLNEIELLPLQERYHMYDSFCWQAFGELYTPTIPPILCLQSGKPASSRILSDHDLC
ncbi:Polygalacturonase [Apostasia shenzhenica]|uniref:Polygalacturonase n=1 Tax=Apostasia shenzhenica TaxID=1088818 RepID=A0A2I0BFJ1_9ASPA|nr:Polygalacturonase [Apostasia shenzhenica]